MSLHLGKWIAICDRCGLRYLSSELQKDWQGLMVCKNDYEARHPADLIRVPSETAIPSWTRPEAEDEFIDICYLWERSSYSDLATADCSLADNTTFSYPFLLALKNGT